MILARIAAGIMLTLIWGLTESPLLGVAFVLLMTALSAVRYRIKPYSWLYVAEIAACLITALIWLPALLGLWLAIISILEKRWREHELEILTQDDENRSARLKLESMHEKSELELQNAMRLTELAERSRIAQEIHDNVGHEVSGALIALRTALAVYPGDDANAKELLKQAESRLESAAVNLREAVHNLKPAKLGTESGIAQLEALCNDFTFCETSFTVSGDLDTRHCGLLTANLKEALTNISRHSNATLVKIKLESNADYIRMTVHDNGESKPGFKPGLGLSGMKERIRAAGGTMSIHTDGGFKIIGVIPR